jgi:cytochrome c-type biogenesis protein CcmH/NrfG
MKRSLLAGGLCLAALLIGGEAFAQTGTARGKVVDEKDQPVPEAQVLLEYQGGVTRKMETKTNKKGEFTQVGMYPGPYKITISKEGFAPAVIEYRIAMGEPTYLPDVKILSKAAAQAATRDPVREELTANFKKATELTQAGQLDQAEVLYKEILVKHPSVPEVHYNLGYVYAQKKDWPSAEGAYLKAIELRPNYGEAYTALSRVYSNSGQQAKATEILAKAAAENQGDPKVQFGVAVDLFNQGKADEAAAAFQKVLGLDPNHAESYYFLGSLAVQQNKIPEAVTHLEKYLSMNPTNAQNVATAQGLLQALKPKQ